MAYETLRDLYVDQIQDLYSAESQILDALPKLIDKASHVRLRDGFQHHLEQTRQHAVRLEQIARRLNEAPHGKTCRGMAGLLKEGEDFIKDDGDQDVIDAGLIAAAQRVEHNARDRRYSRPSIRMPRALRRQPTLRAGPVRARFRLAA